MLQSKILWRLFFGYAIVIVISIVMVGVLVHRQVAQSSIDDVYESLAVRSELLVEVAKPFLQDLSVADPEGNPQSRYQNLQLTLTHLNKNSTNRLTILDRNGFVVVDSMLDPRAMGNHSQRPEIIDARQRGAATVERFSQTMQRQYLYRALRVENNGELLGFVRVALPRAAIDEQLAELRSAFLVGAAVAAFAALVLGFYFAKSFADPITRMTEVAEAMSHGNYAKRVAITGPDEIGKLGETLNRMARVSAERMEEITAERNRLEEIFSGMVEGVIGVDETQRIILINQAAANLLGISATLCLYKPIWMEVRVQEILVTLEKAMASGDVVQSQMRQIQPGSNEERVVDIHAAPLDHDGNLAGAVIVLHDISELDRLERIRRDFVANASHELKTPITAIRGLAETILYDGETDNDSMDQETQKRFVEKIRVQSLRLSSLVVDLMTLSRLESHQGEGRSQSFDFVELIKRSVNAVRIHCQEKKQTLSIELPEEKVPVAGDPEAVGQMVDNLIDNAVKYTPVNGSIAIKLTVKHGSVELEVTDTGIGISAQHQQRIFERFYRVDKARSRDLGGTGLGLSIVKNIAEQHGGKVTLDSRLGAGSTFRITLPLIR